MFRVTHMSQACVCMDILDCVMPRGPVFLISLRMCPRLHLLAGGGSGGGPIPEARVCPLVGFAVQLTEVNESSLSLRHGQSEPLKMAN